MSIRRFQSPNRFRLLTLIAVSAAVLAVTAPASAASKVPISFDDYHGYTATVKYLKDVAAAYPQITALLEIGKSNMGRPIYVLVVSNRKTGTTVDAHVAIRNPRGEGVKNVAPMTPDMGKAGHWICGATHGNEYTGTEVCLYTIDKLVSGYGADKETTAFVDGKAFYICPIVNPDGVFNSLEKGLWQRQNSALKDDDGDGKTNEDGSDDLDGDGVMAQFRYKDPRGMYVVDDEDPRIMVRLRATDKTDKPRYSVVFEDKDNDGDKRSGEDPEAGIDLNRNFPEGWWNDQGFAGGSGDYPTSAPESRALAEFFVTHPNISMAQFYHTMGGFTFRPLGTAPHTRLDPQDVAVLDFVMGRKYLETIGEDVPEAWKDPTRIPELREELRKTSKNKYAIERGYELPFGWKVSYDEVNDRRYGFGMTTDWDFLQLGVWSITTELWNPAKDIPGLPRTSGAVATAEGPAARLALDRSLLKHQDEKYGGRLFVRWKPFKHPELGDGEIGGWNPKYVSNAWPGEPLAGVCDKHYRFEMFRAGLMPDVAIVEAKARLLYTSESASEATAAVAGGEVRIKKGDAKGKYRIIEVTAVVENKGPLATHTARGSALRGNREDVVWLVGARDKVTFLQGTPYQRLGVLDGAMKVPGPAGGGSERVRGTGSGAPAEEYSPQPPPQFQRRGGPPGPTQVRQGGARREVRWLVAVEGDSLLKVVVSS
ncbi:MAG: hypothetical protein HGA94_02540, partial [Candidatus Aminicenantes bacterium]|nr:hypothetical protein [Candidatus Aminicenantes bacterium]